MTTLALTELTLSHFRSHKLARVSCGPLPVAIYGPNGAGKTNILEAVSLFSPGRGMRRASAEDMTRRPEALGWKITGLLQSQDQTHEIEMWSENGNPRSTKANSKPVPQNRLADLSRVLWLIPAMDRLWIEGAEGRRRFLDRMALSFFPNHAEASLTYEKTMRERNKLLKENVRDPMWYGVLETRLAETGAIIHENRVQTLTFLSLAQAKAETPFPTADLELIHAEDAMPADSADLKDAFEASRFRDLAAGRTLVGPHRADLYGVFTAKEIAAKDCSTGEQKALLISLILANARALAEQIGAPPILLLDEVAAHLDADRRAALYSEISALGAQAWMTGTEASLFDSLSTQSVHLEVTENTGISETKVISQS